MIDFDYIDGAYDRDDEGDGDDWESAGYTVEPDEDRPRVGSPYRRSAAVSHRPETAAARAETMLALLERPEWHQWAACRDTPGFFDLPTDEAVKRCAVCPVTTECAEAGVGEVFGVWNGERKHGDGMLAATSSPECGLVDRILNLVTAHPYKLTANEIEGQIRRRKSDTRAAVRLLADEGRLARYEIVAGGRGRNRIVYGPGEVRP